MSRLHADFRYLRTESLAVFSRAGSAFVICTLHPLHSVDRGLGGYRYRVSER